MSISSQITRISGNVSNALTAIGNKGVTIPSGANSDDLATLIAQIETGGGGSDEPVETLLGSTPYTLLEDADIKLVGSGAYTYGVSAIDAEFADRKNVTLNNTTLTDNGTYWELADTGASVWYSATANMYFDGLVSGTSYTVTVDSLGDGTTCTGGYWVIRDATGSNTYGVIDPLSGTNTLTFVATESSINVFMAPADSTSFDSGVKVARWRGMTITHTESTSGTDDTLLGELKAGTQITSSPTVQVYAIVSDGGGGSATLITKTITENGTYSASNDSADGYSSVTVNVPGITPTGTLNITENNTYDVTNYASAVVNVPSSASSGWTKVAETSYQVSTTSTSAATHATWATGHSELWTDEKFVYVRIRDTAGKRAGYFYGSDQFFVFYSLGSASTTSSIRFYTRYNTGGSYTAGATSGTTGYGVYADTIYSDGRIRIRKRYNSSTTLTIDGTYKVEVYLLDPAGGIPIFE